MDGLVPVHLDVLASAPSLGPLFPPVSVSELSKRDEDAITMLRLVRRGLATRPLSADELIARGQFIKKSFQLFDLNSDKKIELHELETAYLHNSAGSEVVRLLEETGELGGKGVTWELLVLRFL